MEKADENYSHNQGFSEPVNMIDSSGVDRGLSFADVMQFADFGPKLGLEQNQMVMYDNADVYSNPVQLEFMGNDAGDNNSNEKVAEKTTKRKRPRSVKTTEEVESQRMTHIAVERNRRKQMNEHLRVLRALMPSSYVQRGDQASIIGGAIEFVRELEQLLQCLESQKRRRLYGDQVTSPVPLVPTQYQDDVDQVRLAEADPTNYNAGLLWEDTAESKSSIADVEVKMSGFNALIKILSRRRPGQLIKIIADLEELNMCILHTNITTIEQTVLYSLNVQVSSEARFTAEDIAASIQQIFTFIHAN